MIFWLLLGVLSLVCIALLVWPLRRHPAVSDELADTVRTDQVRRLTEFEDDLAAGEIDQSQSEAVLADIQRAAINANTPDTVPISSRQPMALIALALVLPLLASFFYAHLGSPHVARFVAGNPEIPLSSKQAAARLLLAELKQHVETTPEDIAAAELLARTQLRVGDNDDALETASLLYESNPDNIEALLLLIDIRVTNAKGEFDPTTRELINRTKAVAPTHPTALVIRGAVALKDGQVATAVELWRSAFETLPPDSPLRRELAAMLDVEPDQDAAQAALEVTVSQAQELTACGDAKALFVLARDPQGGPPLAARRLVDADLPVTVVLDKNAAMMAGRTLNPGAAVTVVARASLSGDAQARAGDCEGSVDTVVTGSVTQLAITIDHIIE